MTSKNRHAITKPAPKAETPKAEEHARKDDPEVKEVEKKAEEIGAPIPEESAEKIVAEQKKEEQEDRRGTFKKPQSRSVKAALHEILINHPGKEFTMGDFVKMCSEPNRPATPVTIRTGLTDLKSKTWSKPFTPIEIAKSKKADGTETWMFVDRRKVEHSAKEEHSAETKAEAQQEDSKSDAPAQQQAHA